MISAIFNHSSKTIKIVEEQPTPFDRIEIRLPGCCINIEPHIVTEGEIAIDQEETSLSNKLNKSIKIDRFPAGFVPIQSEAFIKNYQIKEVSCD